ncbi:MAG: hypothetical protein ACLR0U_11325 [Enterocloster clostridioformis]
MMELLENKMITKQQRNYIDEWFDNFAQVFVAVSDIHMIDGDGQIRYSYVPYEGYVDKERLKACTQEAADRPDRGDMAGHWTDLSAGKREKMWSPWCGR